MASRAQHLASWLKSGGRPAGTATALRSVFFISINIVVIGIIGIILLLGTG